MQKRFLGFEALLAPHATVNDDYRLLPPQQRAHAGVEVAQRVTVLGENDQLLAWGGRGRWESAGPIRGGVFCHLISDSGGRKNDAEQARQLAPLAVCAAATHGAGERFKAPEGGDLGL